MEVKSIRQDIEQLRELFDFDSEVDVLRRRQRKLPKLLEEKRKPLAEAEARLKSFQDNLSALETELAKIQKEIELENQNIEKSNEKLMSVKTNEQYQAAVREIDNAKKLNREREDNVLRLMEEIEKFKGELPTHESVVEEERQKIEAEINDINDKLETANAELKTNEGKRKQYVDKIDDAQLLRVYEHVREQWPNPMSEIRGESCSACQMAVPPQIVNMVLRQESVQQCPSCRRILFLPDESDQPAEES